MLDFLRISSRSPRRGEIEIYPKFVINNHSSDLMIRGGDFYAIWNEATGLWSTDEQDVVTLVDLELEAFYEKHKLEFGTGARVLYMWDSESGVIDGWHKYCQKQMRDNFVMLDERLAFANDIPSKKEYVSKRLPYPLEAGTIDAYDQLVGTLYTPTERHKLEWAIGSIVSGDSRNIQKFMVLYGAPGSGKGTVINIILMLFAGYTAVFDAKALGSASNAFALEAFRSNPLVAIQHDGDLSRIEDNTRLNSLVSHELMTVNEKFKPTYPNEFKCFLFLGTNKPVKITDAKSGLIRRLIDVSPSGDKLPASLYNDLVRKVKFELSGIAKHCLDVYMDDKHAYDAYIPVNMLGASNDFYNFMIDSYSVFKKEDGTTLSAAWEMYKTYCDDAKVPFPLSKRPFKEELSNYFDSYSDRVSMDDGSRIRSYYQGFKYEKFEDQIVVPTESVKTQLSLTSDESVFDFIFKDCPAQYANENETPLRAWVNVNSTLSKINTQKIHYVKVPENLIVIDFDLKDANKQKSLSLNLEAASKWPPTYAELSKGGAGVHLHYYYSGDVSKLSNLYDTDIEVKVFTGNSTLRRKLTKCNDLPIASINSGLPLKGECPVVNQKSVSSERKLRELILRNMNKEIHSSTKLSVNFIDKILTDAYNNGLNYDVSDMRRSIFNFASMSTNNADYCMSLVNKMKFKSDEISIPDKNDVVLNNDLVFFDVEVFPNLFVIVWKKRGPDNKCVIMINPTSSEIEPLLKFLLIGFNCRNYDNHIVYARYIGYTNEQLFDLSQRIIADGKGRGCKFGEAYNLSYTDIYDFASAGNKKSLKKLEIEMGIHHMELGLPWDKPVPPELWVKVGEYCCNDVIATEAAFDYLSADWTARQILADLAGLTVNDTTNTLSTKIIFGDNKKPQSQFRYRDLSKPVHDMDEAMYAFLSDACPIMMSQTHGLEESLLPYFPGYKYEGGKSTYKGENVGEGGFVSSKPGVYGNVALLDIVSMHPHTAIAECVFGPVFTAAFRDIVEGRVSIKHEAWDIVNKMLDGKLTPYIQKVIDGELTSKDLANALKTAINSVYGLTSASFENAFRDPRNIDNIVAKRGALFMIDLKEAVLAKGFEVAHIKTDSIKIPDATPEIINFVMDFGRKYGYEFEHEATYDRICLVNDAVYIARYASVEKCNGLYGYCPGDNHKKENTWSATGTQFAVPYVFKTLFSKEDIVFDDLCETKSTTSAIYLDFNEMLPNVEAYEKEYTKLNKLLASGKPTPFGSEERVLELEKLIAEGHNYLFVGKVGQFCPVRPGFNGGVLYRCKDGVYNSLSGSKGYRWIESETLRAMDRPEYIDNSYYDNLVSDAASAISNYAGLEWFCSDKPYDYYDNDIIPF